MITFKTLTVEELKKDYLNRHGFLFFSTVKCSNDSIESLCQVLIDKDITPEYPELVSRIDENHTVFIYNIFDSPAFILKAYRICQFVGNCRVETLHNYIKSI